MKKLLATLLILVACIHVNAQESRQIRISTDRTDLILEVAPDGRLYQSYLGDRLLNEQDLKNLSGSSRGWEVYPGSGGEDYFEPAVAITNNDGNLSTILRYVSSEQKAVEGGTETIIRMKDDQYPVDVTLHYVAYPKQNVIKTWSEIKHQQKKPVVLWRYASTMLYFSNQKYYLTEFSSDWAKEVQMSTQQLQPGKKILDTKLGSRAAMHMQPFFELGLEQPAQEHQGQVVLGTIGWTGNYQFTFEVDNEGNLRIIPAINPYASDYQLKANETFTTPEFIFTLSNNGTGEASRNLHNWARNYQLKDGKGDRMTLLNNWENTYFTFDEELLGKLMKEAKHLGVDMFLLDDGWFANKYPRSGDHQGLGDWEETKDKLPNGIAKLVEEANAKGIKFGLWIEPEMVSPKSELYEKHKDWVIRFPNRDEYYFRNQLVLDLSNPEVQDYVFNVVDRLKTENPGIAYFKWDCNSPITNIYSAYLKDKQSHLYVDHIHGLYKVLERIQKKYPDLPMMLCSGGGGRTDYEALKYFTEFWPSDNTDAVERIFIQWGYSYLFPSKAMAAHVTSWGKQPLKFRVDVASMGKLGFDIRTHEMNENEIRFCQEAVKNFKRLSHVIGNGDMYRIVSPYEKDHAVVLYTDQAKDKAVVYAFDMHPRYAEILQPVRLQGLDANKRYKVEEINLMPGNHSALECHGKTYSGDYLMKVGIPLLSSSHLQSHVVELTAE